MLENFAVKLFLNQGLPILCNFHFNFQLLAPVVVSILQEAMKSCSSSATEITPGLLMKDAAYGAAAYVYYELSNYLSFRDWYDYSLRTLSAYISSGFVV